MAWWWRTQQPGTIQKPKLYHYIDDIVLTFYSLPDLENAAPLLVHHLQKQG